MVKWRPGRKKSQSKGDLEDTAREMADRLDLVREWLEDVQHIAAPDAKTFYSHELLSDEHLLALRDILGELGDFEEPVVPAAESRFDDEGWEDESEASG